jgi:hypothetical protein
MNLATTLVGGEKISASIGEYYASLPLPHGVAAELGRRWQCVYGAAVDAVSLLRELGISPPALRIVETQVGTMTRVAMKIDGVHAWFHGRTAIGAILRIIDRAIKHADSVVSRHGGLYHTQTAGGRARLDRAKREAADTVRSLCSEWAVLAADLIEFGGEIIMADGRDGCARSYPNKFFPAATHAAKGWQYGIHIRTSKVYSRDTHDRLAAQTAEYVAEKVAGEASRNLATPASAQQIASAAKRGTKDYLAAIQTIQPREGENWSKWCRTMVAYHIHLIRTHVETGSYFVPEATMMCPSPADYAMVDAAFSSGVKGSEFLDRQPS